MVYDLSDLGPWYCIKLFIKKERRISVSKLKNLIYRLRGEVSTEVLVSQGMKVGKNFERMNNVLIDDSHAWLIEIGDDVTLAPRVHILAHDASTKKHLGYTKIGCVTIGNNVFIGAESVVLPGVNIGDNAIIGANSTVTHDVPSGYVVVGSPACVICTTEEYLQKQKERMLSLPVYGEEYTMRKSITSEMKQKQRDEVKKSGGGFVK